jgi:hypothetical protein
MAAKPTREEQIEELERVIAHLRGERVGVEKHSAERIAILESIIDELRRNQK